MTLFFRKLLFIIFFLLVAVPFVSRVEAADIRTDYQVQYILSTSKKALNTKVIFRIKITNLSSEIYVKNFTIAFPASFLVSNLVASDDNGSIQPEVTKSEAGTKIDLQFSDPKIGNNVSNTFNLEFNQDKLFNASGNVWEVILPTLQSKQNEQSTYKVIVNLPTESDKRISIAKPKPNIIAGKQIIWDNPKTRTIYAVFGDKQYYDANLSYHIQNPKLTPVYTDIAFPPQTAYQDIWVNDIEPEPETVYIDGDGNYIGRYYLKPKEIRDITFKGIIEVRTTPDESLIPIINAEFPKQQPYLLNQSKYWSLAQDQLDGVKKLQTPADIYQYVVTNLSYNYQNVKEGSKRLGAAEALRKPNQAVCVEFADLFTAIAREKGIFTREIEGYGFTQDPKLRPISLLSDILHSWPEYYDQKSGRWIAVDPTWENTSGIDYFSSLDLNHIVFAIHGKDPDYPLPAGMYKIGSSQQDVFIKPSETFPTRNQSEKLTVTGLPDKMVTNKKYTVNISVKNTGNVFLRNISLSFNAPGLRIKPEKTTISVLAPYQNSQYPIEISATDEKRKETEVNITLNGEKKYTKHAVIQPYTQNLAYKLFIIALGSATVLVLVKLLFRKKREQPYEDQTTRLS